MSFMKRFSPGVKKREPEFAIAKENAPPPTNGSKIRVFDLLKSCGMLDNKKGSTLLFPPAHLKKG